MMKHWIILFIAGVLPFANGQSRIQLIGRVQCNDYLDIRYLNVNCGDSAQDYCTFGSSAALTGQFNTSSYLPEKVQVVVEKKYLNIHFWGQVLDKQYNVFGGSDDGTSLTAPAGNDAGYACPEPGLYNFNTNFLVWGEEDTWSSPFPYRLNLTINVYEVSSEDSSVSSEPWTECWVRVGVRPDHPWWQSSSSFFAGSLAFIFIGFGVVRKNRRIVTRSTEEEEEECDFEMMNDPSNISTIA